MEKARLAAFAAAAALAAACGEAPVATPPPPPEVYVLPVVQKDVPVYLELVGQTRGFQDVEIRARVEGFLERVDFREGTFGSRGRAALRHRSQAARSDRSPRRRPTRRPLRRGSPRPKTTSPATRRSSRSRRSASRSWTTRARRTRCVAIAGRGGEGRAREGDARSRLHPHHLADQRTGRHDAGEARQSRRPRREHAADDDLADRPDDLPRSASPRADYLRIARRGLQRGNASGRGGSAPVDGIQLTLADGTVYPQTGRVGPVERAVDPTTGTLGVQIMFPNPDLILRPGPVRPRAAAARDEAGRLLVPQRAVQELQNLYSVAVVDDEQQGGVPERQGRPAGRFAVGHRRGAQAWRAGRRRRAAARAGRHDRHAEGAAGGSDAASGIDVRGSAAGPNRRRGEVDHGPLLRQPADRRDGASRSSRCCSASSRCRGCRSRSTPRSSRR